MTIQRDWQAERRWVAQIIDKEMQPVLGEIGAICGRLERRIGACEVAVTELLMEQEKRIAALEARLAELEQRAVLKPPKPRLVSGSGGSDAA